MNQTLKWRYERTVYLLFSLLLAFVSVPLRSLPLSLIACGYGLKVYFFHGETDAKIWLRKKYRKLYKWAKRKFKW